jgi:hypothetical protein
MRSGSLFERPTLELPTVETDGSASRGDETEWQTPASFLGKYRRQVHQTERTEKLLPAQAEDTKWPTPRTITGGAESAERKKELGRIDSGGGDLQAKVQDWPTPTSRDWRSGQASPETMDRNSRPLSEAAETTFPSGLPAPQISTPGPECSQDDRTSPQRWPMEWPTPVVAADEKSASAMASRATAGPRGQSSPPGLGTMARLAAGDSPPLPPDDQMAPRTREVVETMRSWPTPVVTDALGARNATSTRPEDSKHHSGTTLTDAIQPTNEVTKKTAARLNPRFVEWLMGWPISQTEL